jgi:hypothetical protein
MHALFFSIGSNIRAFAAIPEILQSPSLGLGLTLLGIALSVVGVVLGIRSRSKARMAYQTHDFALVGQPDANSVGEIKILFNDSPVPRVVVTQLAVWNAGSTTVRSDDIVAADPLAVCFEPDVLILGTRRLKATQAVNDFRIRLQEQDRTRALLEFDYLNSGDGAVFEIIHTGAKGKAKVTGSLRGISRGVESWGDLQEWDEQKSRLASSSSGLVGPGAFMVVVLLFGWLRNMAGRKHPSIAAVMDLIATGFGLLIAVFFISIVGFIVIYSLRARSRATPKALSRS